MSNGRIVVVVTSNPRLGHTGRATGAFLSEVAHPHHVFSEAGFAVDFASPRGGEIPIDPGSLDGLDKVATAFHEDSAIQTALQRTTRGEDVDPGAYDAVFFAGGHGTMWDFPDDLALQRLAVAVFAAGGVVGAVCHGPAALVNARLENGRHLVDGARVAAFTTEEEKLVGLDVVVPFLLDERLREHGASLEAGAPFEPYTVRDGNLVTGQNPASAYGVGERMVEALNERSG